MVQCVVI